MEAFFGTLGLTVISAITLVAYKHPQAYDKLYPKLLMLLLLVYACIVSWDIGANHAWSAVEGLFPTDKKEAARAALEATRPPILWTSAIYIAIVTYILFLTTLPLWLLTEHDKK